MLGCDEDNTDTETTGSVSRPFELDVELPVHWFLRQLHVNNWNISHLRLNLDNKTVRPKSCSSPSVRPAPDRPGIETLLHSIPYWGTWQICRSIWSSS